MVAVQIDSASRGEAEASATLSVREERRLARLETRVQTAINRIAGVRLVAFLTTVICGITLVYDRIFMPYGPIAVVSGVVFLVAVLLHRKPYRMMPRVKERRRTAREDVARLWHDWQGIDETGIRYLDPSRPDLGELQIFGQHSLYQLVNRAGLPWGRDRVAEALRDGVEQAGLQATHQAALELRNKRVLRERVAVESRLVDVDDEDLQTLLRWAEHDPPITRWIDTAYWLSLALVPTTIFQVVMTLGFGWVTLWQASFLAQLILFAASTTKLTPYYIHLIGNPKERPIVALRAVFERVEKVRYTSERLQTLQSRWRGGNGQVSSSTRILRFERVVDALAVRHGALLYSVLAICLLWEVVQCRRLERWRKQFGHALRQDLEALAEFEYICSVAGFAALNPNFSWPSIHGADHDGAPILAEGLGHPLINADVRRNNDFSLPGTGHLMLVTGSNMSGKSTFLRTVGVNVRLALGGFPVCATRLEVVLCELRTSIQVVDSPTEGLSRFYAEVKRLAQVLKAVESGEDQGQLRQLYLIDEMLSGTNSRERSLASQHIVRALVNSSAGFGLVTTHDLALVSVENDLPGRVICTHFADRFDGDAMHFDYQMKPGVAQTTNALRVLELEGIIVEDSTKS